MNFDRDGNHLSASGNGAFLYAHSIFIEDDIVYLTDRDSSVCLIYTLDGKPIQMHRQNNPCQSGAVHT